MRSLLSAVLLGLLLAPARAQEDNPARKMADRVIKAVGGEKNLKGFDAHNLKVKGRLEVLGQQVEISGDWSLRGLDRYRWDSEFTIQNRTNRASLTGKGESAWIVGDNGQANDLPQEIATALLANARAIRLVQNPLLLRDPSLKLEPLGRLKVDGRELACLKVTTKGLPDVDLFLDDKTGLPVKCELRMVDVKDGMEVAHTLLFDDFKEFDGVKHFTRFRFQRDGSTALELETSDVSVKETIDDTVFAKP